MIVAGPDIHQGSRIDELVCHFDLFQTLCELIGLEAPKGLEGRSLVPVMKGESGRDELYLAYGSTIRGLLQDNWKLIEYAASGYRATQLFDMDSDTSESFDQSRNPDQIDRLKAMRERLREMAQDIGDIDRDDGKAFWESYIIHTPAPKMGKCRPS